MFIWEKFRINYVFIFEMNSRKHVQWQHVLEVEIVLFLDYNDFF